jgi:hypothetical protein
MQPRPNASAGTRDIAGVLRDARFMQDNVKFHIRIKYNIFWLKSQDGFNPGVGEGYAVLGFYQSRDGLSGGGAERSARLAQTAKRFVSSRRRRRSAGEARRQTRVSQRYCEKSADFGNGSVPYRRK